MDLEPFTFILERVGQLLFDEVKLLSTDKNKLLVRLQQQLELAQSLVRDIEEEKQRATISHVLETEFRHIMLILPQIEDYLDTLQLEDAQESQKKSALWKIKAFFSCTSNLLVRKHVVIDTALELIDDLEDTCKRAEPYQRQSNITQITRRRRPPTQPNIMNEEFIVGLDEDVRILIAKLAEKNTTILAIAGMGGSGKTTLARKLYNHQEVKRLFGNQSWVCVSKDWDTSQLLRQMCVQLHVPLEESETLAAGYKLREFLQMSSSLIVLDDVWEMAALQELLPLLLPGGCTILVTTRNEEILHYPVRGRVYIHRARALTQEQSWELFSKIVCNEWNGIRSLDAESVFVESGREMLKRCHGLPLAIVALAGLLSTRDSIQEWETMKKNVSSRIMRQNKGFLDYGPVKDMLELSYSDLPYDLKPCFLYLGIYPEDRWLDVEDLIQLWIGEGFLRPNLCYEGQTLEELGMDVVNELVQRCMVQVDRRDYEEKVEIIQVHDLMRDLCIQKARESGFLVIASSSTMPTDIMDLKSRRAIIPGDGHLYSIGSSGLRSIIKFSKYEERSIELKMLYESMRLLRVLDIENVDLRNSEVLIGKLILLRHLRIWRCNGTMNLVLDSVKKLRNLLTLKFYTDDESLKIPNDMMGGMVHLRSLSLGGYFSTQFEVPTILGLGRSRNLQSLELPAGEWLCKDLQAVSLIHTLRRLKLSGIDTQIQLDAVSDFVGTPSKHLQVLHLDVNDGLEFDLRRMNLEHCSQLKSLNLKGRIGKRYGLFFPLNLLNLMLQETHIEKGEDFGTALAQLRQLRRLELLTDSYDGDKLTTVGLPQLHHLVVSDLHNLKEWRIEHGAICRLKYLHISKCSKLERIPKEISGIHTLQHLSVFSMPLSFYKELKKPSKEEGNNGKDGGEDFHLVRHIPSIFIMDQDYRRYDDEDEEHDCPP